MNGHDYQDDQFGGLFKSLSKLITKPAKSVLKTVGLIHKKDDEPDTDEIADQVTTILQTPPEVSPATLTQNQLLLLGGGAILAIMLLKGKK